MTSNSNLDPVLEAWFSDTARPAPAGLHREAIARVRLARQRRPWSAAVIPVVRRPRTFHVGLAIRLAAALALLTVLAAVVLLNGAQPPIPLPPASASATASPRLTSSPLPTVSSTPAATPTPTLGTSPSPTPFGTPTTKFLAPFTYVMPSAEAVRWVPDNAVAAGFVGPGPSPAGNTYDYFQETADHGVVVARLGGTWLHVCAPAPSGPERRPIRVYGADFLTDLEQLGGILYSAPETITFDGRPALLARRTGTKLDCGFDIHPGGGLRPFILMGTKGQSILVAVNERPVMIDIWAKTDEELDSWLPTAMEFVQSIHFIDQP